MVKADNLTKRFQGVTAVDHIHAEIQDGTVFGLIGTNGAGKSTFLRMAAGPVRIGALSAQGTSPRSHGKAVRISVTNLPHQSGKLLFVALLCL